MAKSTPKAKAKTFKDSLASTLPWNHTSFGEDVEIEACAAGTNKWETIADVRSFLGFDGEDIASFIVTAVNEHEKTRQLLGDLTELTEALLASKPLSEKVRKNAEATLTQVRALIGECT